MKKILPIGYEDFKEIIEKDLYYVDKTEVINDLLNNKNKVALFPRPRRFGKSLFISMLENFFNIEKKETNNHLFEGLNISKSNYYNQLSSRPVIKLDFKRLKDNNYETMLDSYKGIIWELYSDKRYLLETLQEDQKILFYKFLNKEASLSEYQTSIQLLSKFLYQHYQKKVIILIDEYDVPIQQGYLKDFYEDIVSFIREVFSSALKGNEYVEMAIMTGVLRVSKESLFSDLNNVKVYGIMDKGYNEYFGFTEKETRKLLQDYDLELTSDVKNMYDGYNFNGVSIYNPWSILNYADNLELIPYWINTSGNELIMSAMENVDDEVKVLIESLISGNSIPFTYDDKVTYLDVSKIHSITGIINFFLQTGYLTIDNQYPFDIYNLYAKMPNNEIKQAFGLMLNRLLDKTVVNGDYLIKQLKKYLLNQNKEMVEEILNKLLLSLSFYDTYENFYHGYVLGLFSAFINDKYIVKSNRESGMGRFDVMIESFDRTLGFLFEFKITKDDMEESAKKALSQMKEKEYYQELVLDKVEKIHEYAIIFKGKKAIVR